MALFIVNTHKNPKQNKTFIHLSLNDTTGTLCLGMAYFFLLIIDLEKYSIIQVGGDMWRTYNSIHCSNQGQKDQVAG